MQTKKQRTTMSVPEMRTLLGLGKTEAYWLIHKNCFDTILVEGRMRVVLSSFETWYAGQVKYSKVNGPKPGERLCRESLSIHELAELLDLNESCVYDLLKKEQISTVTVDFQRRVPRDAFDQWYGKQSRYRLPKDRERDQAAEAATYALPEIARLLGIHRNMVYYLVNHCQGQWAIFTLAGKTRVTKESFECWYQSQDRYVKISDRSPAEQKRLKAEERRKKKIKEMPRLTVSADKSMYSIQETAILLDVTERDVYKLIEYQELKATKLGTKWRIAKDDIQWWLDQQRKANEE